MSANSARWPKKIVGSAVALSIILINFNAFAAYTDNISLNSQQLNHPADACRAGLKFGISADHIPVECNASLIKTLTTETGHKEKWQYRGGYLFFDNGVLMAIQQMNP